uniref:Cell division cycle 25C n=1 Tax=Lepisosteus oculatus TaxID=7918 RepID=W5MTK3_LEPOC|nr:PREDICTED: M-phase inducer phosphatase 3 [Lepisosteus oculatus]
MQSDEQDGFTMVLDESCGNPHMTSSMARLLSDPLMSQEVEVSWLQPQPPRGGSRRLVRSPSMPERLDRPVLKRAPAPPDPGPDPCPLAKRWRSTAPIHEEEEEEGDGRKRGRLLKKTLSLSDVETRGEPGDLGLIGDFSKVRQSRCTPDSQPATLGVCARASSCACVCVSAFSCGYVCVAPTSAHLGSSVQQGSGFTSLGG